MTIVTRKRTNMSSSTVPTIDDVSFNKSNEINITSSAICTSPEYQEAFTYVTFCMDQQKSGSLVLYGSLRYLFLKQLLHDLSQKNSIQSNKTVLNPLYKTRFSISRVSTKVYYVDTRFHTSKHAIQVLEDEVEDAVAEEEDKENISSKKDDILFYRIVIVDGWERWSASPDHQSLLYKLLNHQAHAVDLNKALSTNTDFSSFSSARHASFNLIVIGLSSIMFEVQEWLFGVLEKRVKSRHSGTLIYCGESVRKVGTKGETTATDHQLLDFAELLKTVKPPTVSKRTRHLATKKEGLVTHTIELIYEENDVSSCALSIADQVHYFDTLQGGMDCLLRCLTEDELLVLYSLAHLTETAESAESRSSFQTIKRRGRPKKISNDNPGQSSTSSRSTNHYFNLPDLERCISMWTSTVGYTTPLLPMKVSPGRIAQAMIGIYTKKPTLFIFNKDDNCINPYADYYGQEWCLAVPATYVWMLANHVLERSAQKAFANKSDRVIRELDKLMISEGEKTRADEEDCLLELVEENLSCKWSESIIRLSKSLLATWKK